MRIAAARVSLGLFVLLSVCGAAWGQATARLAGIVKDPSGGSVAGAAITLTNEGTNVSRKTTTDADGNFLFPQVEPGVYRATIERTGFKKFIQSGITLEVNQNGRLEAELSIG